MTLIPLIIESFFSEIMSNFWWPTWKSNKNYILLELISEPKAPPSWPLYSQLHHWCYAILQRAVDVFLYFYSFYCTYCTNAMNYLSIRFSSKVVYFVILYEPAVTLLCLINVVQKLFSTPLDVFVLNCA